MLLIAWAFFTTLFYKTLIVMLIALVWQGKLRGKLPERVKPWGIKAMWTCLAITLWVAMPRYRINSSDRVRMVYLDENTPIWRMARPLQRQQID